jgi:transcription elongation factor GreB
MSRWRPPPEKSTALITRAGHDRLKAELDELWRVRRPEVVKALAAAAAEGDRSENAEYTYRKKQLAEIDRRVRYLSKRVPALRVVDTTPSDPDAVFFGAQVEIENAVSGDCQRYRIVGPDETDARSGWISIDSPLARAMLKKRIDDEFDATTARGRGPLRDRRHPVRQRQPLNNQGSIPQRSGAIRRRSRNVRATGG